MTERKTRPGRVAVNTFAELPKTPAELAAHAELLDRMRDVTAKLHQRNLDKALALAQAAAQGRLEAMGEGDLAAHFAELGRRFSEVLDRPRPRPGLKVLEGGAA